MKTILDKIVDYKKQELASLRRRVSLKDVQLKAADAEPARFFCGGFKNDAINIIAEIKKASPSAGVIREDFKPIDLALQYEEAGARALSVLTDEHFFQGSLGSLLAVKEKVSLPCLRKDFTLDEYHLFEARAYGADAILLIAAILDSYQLKDFYELSKELGMQALIEVHSEKELNKIQSMGATLVGVNNRNLQTFQVNLDTSLHLVDKIPEEVMVISESGLKTHEDLLKLKDAGFDGFLIGETLMREKDVGGKLRELICADVWTC